MSVWGTLNWNDYDPGETASINAFKRAQAGKPRERYLSKTQVDELLAGWARIQRAIKYGAHPIHLHNGRKPTARRRRRG